MNPSKNRDAKSRDETAERQTELALRVAVCAWCKPGYWGAGPGAISHGICPRHLRKLKQKLQKSLLGKPAPPALLRAPCSRALQRSVDEIAWMLNQESAEVIRTACEEYVARIREAKPLLPLFAQT